MTTWSRLVVEGSHDAEFVATMLVVGVGWESIRKIPTAVARNVGKNPLHLGPRDRSHVIQIIGLDGVDNVLGLSGRKAVQDAGDARGVGIILDADGVGVTARLTAAASQLPAGALPSDYRAGSVSAGAAGKRYGIWVAPDCTSKGSMDSLILAAARSQHAKEVRVAERFVRCIGRVANHAWDQYEQKAIGGAFGQRWRAGGSLASALQERQEWISLAHCKQPPFQQLLNFVLGL